MAPLSLDDIERVVNEARRMGFSVAALNGIRAQLLMRSAQPDGATKLGLALDQMPRTRRQANRDFLDATDAMDTGRMARGRAVLDALSDEEWADVIGPDEDANA